MNKNKILAVISIVIVYSLISYLVDKAYILPGIFDIVLSLKNIVFSTGFLPIVLTTLIRSLTGLLISFVLALFLSLVSYFNRRFSEFMEPVYVMLKTIPNITYIIVALLWLGRNGSAILVSSLVVFPIFYNSFLSALRNIDENLINATRLYNCSLIYKIRKIYLPLIKPQILTSLSNCCSLGFKVSIMAEILSQVRSGIGRELYFAKANLLMADIFAWTIIIIAISYLMDRLIFSFNKRQ